MADGDLLAGLPEVELADLPGSIDGALERPWRRQEQRPHLAQVVIDDRLAAIEPKRRDQLPDPLTRQPRIAAKQPMDLVLERIELRPRRRAGIARRHRRTHGRSDRIARQARPPGELLDRNAAHEVLPAQLGPPLHINQPLTAPPRSPQSSEGPDPPGRLRRHARGVSFRPAEGGQFSPGADITSETTGDRDTRIPRKAGVSSALVRTSAIRPEQSRADSSAA